MQQFKDILYYDATVRKSYHSIWARTLRRFSKVRITGFHPFKLVRNNRYLSKQAALPGVDNSFCVRSEEKYYHHLPSVATGISNMCPKTGHEGNFKLRIWEPLRSWQHAWGETMGSESRQPSLLSLRR